MESNEAASLLQELPTRPHWHFTGLDVTLMVGAPTLAYIGGVVAAQGSLVGPIAAAFAALMTVAIRAIRISRTDEPVISQFTFYSSIFAAVVMFVMAANLWSYAPHPSAAIGFVLPLVGTAAYALFLTNLFWRRR